CTGFAATGALASQPYYSAAGQRAIGDQDPSEFARSLYSDATLADTWPGSWPPEDTGSSGLAICKVLKSRGTITSYRWATTAKGLLRLLQDGPVLMGMPWYSDFFEPDVEGFVDYGPWRGSDLAGGHEVEVVGCQVDQDDLSASVLTIANSWSTSWGDAGYFRMRLGT
ncbi:C1 family peptidase, partial [Planotetraspora phitsanulokensis]